MTDLRDQVAAEAAAAQQAVGALTDEGVAHALELAAALVGERHDAIAEANAADVAAADLDEGALDRLAPRRRAHHRARRAACAARRAAAARARGRELGARQRPAGLAAPHPDRRGRRELRGAAERRRRRRRPAAEEPERRGAAHRRRRAAHRHRPRRRGAASGARRCGAAARGSRPRALARARGRARARLAAERAAARDPARQRRDDGRCSQREAAQHGVRTLAHAEGGGVLYIDAAADPAMAERLVEASLDRLGVCNRLNLLLVDRAAERQLPALLAVLERLGITRARAGADRPRVGERRRAHRVGHGARRRVARRGGGASRTTRRRASPRRS